MGDFLLFAFSPLADVLTNFGGSLFLLLLPFLVIALKMVEIIAMKEDYWYERLGNMIFINFVLVVLYIVLLIIIGATGALSGIAEYHRLSDVK